MVVKCSVTTHASAQHQQNAHRKSPRCLSLVRGLPRVSKYPNSIEPSRARGAGQGARRGAVPFCRVYSKVPSASEYLPACMFLREVGVPSIRCARWVLPACLVLDITPC